MKEGHISVISDSVDGDCLCDAYARLSGLGGCWKDGMEAGDCTACGAALPGCSTEWLRNGICDAECFGPMCDYDGGDCNPHYTLEDGQSISFSFLPEHGVLEPTRDPRASRWGLSALAALQKGGNVSLNMGWHGDKLHSFSLWPALSEWRNGKGNPSGRCWRIVGMLRTCSVIGPDFALRGCHASEFHA